MKLLVGKLSTILEPSIYEGELNPPCNTYKQFKYTNQQFNAIK